ncbi:MAG: methionine adenosyltransferase [Flavobacteriaceae bacterium]|nr:methionine adenosyltransferase [Flavobacteriaceae bacterium]
MPYLFTSESVSEGHPDKIADQISDALIDHFLAFDPNAKVACETLVTTGQVVLAGEVKSNTYLDVQKIARDVIKDIGYTKSEYMFEANSCGILSAIHEQSADINQGVDRAVSETDFETKANAQGAGDQGMMFGYATQETDNYMPLALQLSHDILRELAKIRKEGTAMTYLRPDSKAQVTLEYDDNHQPVSIDSIVVSTQHDPFESEEKMRSSIEADLKKYVIPAVKSAHSRYGYLLDNVKQFHINPTGNFVIGGPHGDTGLTGRKIIVDTYGGRGAHGGGAFSGKDPSKVDRSAAYATRHIAKNLVASGVCEEALVQVSYAIGIAKPTNLFINTYGTAKNGLSDREIEAKVSEIFDLRPYAIEQRFQLRSPIYRETAAYGHMGRTPETKVKRFENPDGSFAEIEVHLFPWEALNYVEQLQKAFNL